MEFNVKIYKNFRWKKRILIIRENDFQLKKVEKIDKVLKKKKQKEKVIYTYPIINALILDQSKNNDFEILIASKDYKQYIKTTNLEDKNKIIQSFENIIKENTFQNVYKEYNEKMAQFNSDENEISPQDFLCCKLFLFKNLMIEMNQKLGDFKSIIKAKPKTKTDNEVIRIYNNVYAVKNEMEKQFEQILDYINKYFDINENLRKKTFKLNSLLVNEMKKNINNEENGKKDKLKNEISSDDELNIRKSDLEKIDNMTEDNKDKNQNVLNKENKNINIIDAKKENNEDINIMKEEKNNILKEDYNINKPENVDIFINENIKKNLENNIKPKDNKLNNLNFNFQYHFLSYNNSDFQNELYNFNKRKKLDKSIIFPQNIVKEMITSMTQKKPAPVYFNEPLSMGQRQCEKFYYLDLLNNICKESQNKSLQLGYISAFIIGEIFLSLNRNLKPFNPIIGETYEFFDNEKKFRYYSEQVSHNPQITAFIGETPDFALYGDTKNSTSFKILKGAMELSFKNKIHLHIKSTNDHFIYNRPNVLIKGFLKPPMHSDYCGTVTIENELFPYNRAEIKFIEESWTTNLGLFEGKIYNGKEIKYLIKGNWNNIIYLVDNKENKIDLLKIDLNQEYLKNGEEGNYKLPTFCYNLNYMDKKLEESLPGNDSRFRKDIRLLEEKTDTKEAQEFKEKYEEKQRKELNNSEHKILFFDEKLDKEGDNYFIPNGKYWEMKKDGQLKNNCNSKIFNINNY